MAVDVPPHRSVSDPTHDTAPARLPVAPTGNTGTAPGQRRGRAKDDSWINVLALSLALASAPAFLLVLMAPLTALSAVVIGIMGVRAARRGEARHAWMGYSAIALGSVIILALGWMLGSAAVQLILHPELD